ncbi:hypothetical protein B0A49_03308 [Cryomyces minteri]|uniref:MADS-box domain-containing protein n=1 Tax=Cryomyces minteri TaxID=331657 RepID=A0A4U0XGS5_9PEZI|nr:hypothetical protein B0A49_09477 [Cryomyces minteri]TKA73845.1 hypothetical protein B0A49_06363 [Cryomyces minteri]TKA76228.1 hypothetical protein B0A49_03308 [Cryomyces minteri]
MGRRKIEIKAIKDDRNRSVTFLKRKGGLFKKAHELSVLCSVDVAVIIFGHNKKLYEFSSGDINDIVGRYQYYGGPHEHKGPADFAGKRDGDDEDEDEDMGSPPPESHSPPDPSRPTHQLQNHASFQHMRQHTPSASPPIPNGQAFHPRARTPQPQGMSRPSSRNTVRRTSSNLVPPQHQQHSQPLPPQPTYVYTPNPPFYNGPASAPMQMKAHRVSMQTHSGPPQNHQGAPRPQQFQYPQPPTHQQVQQAQQQQAYMQEHRRQSMPPAFPPQERPHSVPIPSPPQRFPEPPPPQPPQQQFQSPPLPQPKPLSVAVKSHSIFTPIDDRGSLLAQHWGNSSNAEIPRSEAAVKVEAGPRSQSIDVASMQRSQVSARFPHPPQPGPPPRTPSQPIRTGSTSSIPSGPPTRMNSVQSEAKRPRLKVQIPSEQSDRGSATGESSPKDTAMSTSVTPAAGGMEGSHATGVVLPPPSPSASAILSAGAQGPPNPFARPAPPMNNVNSNNMAYNSNRDIETPISALPSRFVADGLLPSPSSFYPPEWGFGRGGDSNTLPSPLNFQTPIIPNGPGFKDEEFERKRKPSEGPDGGTSKRVRG